MLYAQMQDFLGLYEQILNMVNNLFTSTEIYISQCYQSFKTDYTNAWYTYHQLDQYGTFKRISGTVTQNTVVGT